MADVTKKMPRYVAMVLTALLMGLLAASVLWTVTGW